MKTAELKGVALDWAVAKCEGYPIKTMEGYGDMLWQCGPHAWQPLCKYSTDWAYGGPIIEREGIHLCGGSAQTYDSSKLPDDPWSEYFYVSKDTTILEAAMRCYVASKLGNEIDIPQELV
jgi:hypothetical protein